MRIKFFFALFCTLGLTVSGAVNSFLATEITIGNSVFAQNEPTLIAADYTGRLDELVTPEIASEISGFDASREEKVYENKASAIFGGEKKPPRECSYLWDNGRTRALSMGGNTVIAPYKDKVAIHSVSNTTLDRFKRNYGTLTEEQKLAAAKKLEEEAGKNINSASGQNMSQLGTGMVKNLQAESITGVGEAATWYPNTSELKVFYHGLIFSVVVDVSDDKSINRNKSIELAQRLITEKLR